MSDESEKLPGENLPDTETICYFGNQNMNETITISKKEYDSLVEDAKFMRALEAAGVDNWEGYGIAQDMMEE